MSAKEESYKELVRPPGIDKLSVGRRFESGTAYQYFKGLAFR